MNFMVNVCLFTDVINNATTWILKPPLWVTGESF